VCVCGEGVNVVVICVLYPARGSCDWGFSSLWHGGV